MVASWVPMATGMVLLVSCTVHQSVAVTPPPTTPGSSVTIPPSKASGIHKIKHVIVIMQENRSFDSYFGTYPGAAGIPMKNGVPTACVPDPQALSGCQHPYHDPSLVNVGGPHQAEAATTDIAGGAMNGFVTDALNAPSKGCSKDVQAPECRAGGAGKIDVMGYHDAREIPNYWSYAKQFVLQDHMFEPNLGWSLPAHLFTVSGWSAACRSPQDPMSCHSDLGNPDTYPDKQFPTTPYYGGPT